MSEQDIPNLSTDEPNKGGLSEDSLAALAQESELLSALMANTSDHIYFKDRESKFIRISASQASLFGLKSPMEAVGKSDFDFFTDEHARPAYEDEQRIIATGESLLDLVEQETWEDGRVTWVSTSKIALRNNNGEIIGTFGISRDITEKKEVELSLAYERDLFGVFLDTIPDRVYFKDKDLKYVRCSKAMAEVLGLESRLDIVGTTDFDYFDDGHAQEVLEKSQNVLKTGDLVDGEVVREIWKDGHLSWILNTVLPWVGQNGEIVGVIGVSKDLTHIKEAEKELDDINRRLVDASRQAGMAEVATGILHNVGNVLNSANMSVSVITDQIKSSKISALEKVVSLLEQKSDDLDGFARSDQGKQLPTFLRKILDRMLLEKDQLRQEVEDLEVSVNHIKEVVTMQQDYAMGSQYAETLSVELLFSDALRIHEKAFDRHKVRIETDYRDLPEIKIDKHRVIQILVNLLHNAKYACDEGEAINHNDDKVVTIRTYLKNEDRVVLEVEDNGVGIEKENLDRIFRHGFTTRKNGHGFGLHSCAISAEDIGGSLEVRSAGLGKGAVFILTIPLSPKEEETH